MGLYTTILHDGLDLQIYHGWDACLTYQLGDTIAWEPDLHRPGEHIDGVCPAYGRDEVTHYVVIKDCVVTAIRPNAHDPDTEIPALEREFGITTPDPALWTQAAWDAKAAHKREFDEKYAKWAAVHGDNPALYWMRRKLTERSFASQILPCGRIHGLDISFDEWKDIAPIRHVKTNHGYVPKES